MGTCQCSTAGIRRLRDRSKAVRCRQTVKGSSINGLIALYSPTAAKRIDGKIKPWRLERIKYLVSRHLMRSLEVDSGCDKLPPRPVLRFVNLHRQAYEKKTPFFLWQSTSSHQQMRMKETDHGTFPHANICLYHTRPAVVVVTGEREAGFICIFNHISICCAWIVFNVSLTALLLPSFRVGPF